jgi:hypothetical protein
MFLLFVTSFFTFTHATFSVSCLFLDSSNKLYFFLFFFLGLGREIQSGWKQDCLCV